MSLEKVSSLNQYACYVKINGMHIGDFLNLMIDEILGGPQGTVYNVADVSARDNISDPDEGAIAFISDADGSGNPGISGYDGSWNAPFVISGSGGTGTKYVAFENGALTITIGYEGSIVPTVTVNGVGDYTVNSNGSRIISVDALANNTTITGTGDFILRTDTLAPSGRRWSYDVWNAGNGASNDVFANGNNPTRSISGTVLSLSFPNMQLFGAAGFEIALR